MDPENRSAAIHEISFYETLDNTCIRLQEKQVQYSIKKLEQMDSVLAGLETELDDLVKKI